MTRKIASMFVALSFVFVGTSAALAVDKDKLTVKPATEAVKPVPLPELVVTKCPQGWHVQPGTVEYDGKSFACVPNKPKKKIKCAPKFAYWEKECSFGCQPVIH